MEEQLGFVADINSKPMEDGLNRIEERVESTAKAVEKSGMSVDDFAKHMQGVLSSFEKLTQAVDRNTKAQEQVAEAGKKAADAEKQGADKATDAIQKTDKATQGLGGSLKKTGDEGAAGFDKLQKAAAGFFTLAAAKEFGQKVFEVRSEIQSLQTSFETLVGNKPQAEELFNSIKDFATHTPMQLKDLASAAQTMMSFNIPVEQIMENLKALGDVSMGDAQKFQSLSLSFSQMSATGKLMGQDLLQMINAGFNPLATISEKTGKSIEKLKDEMSKGAISADMVRQAFIDATSEGGKFYGMLEAQSKTLGGAYSNLQGAISDMFNSIGEQTEGIMSGAINAATVLVQNYEKVGKAIIWLISTYGAYKAAVMVNIALERAQAFNRLASAKGLTAMQLATTILTEKTKALNAVLMKNPYILVATAVMSVVSAFVLFNKKTDDAAAKAKELQDELKSQDHELGENRASLQRLQTEWNSLTNDKEKKKWIQENKEEFHNLGLEIDTVQEAENAFVSNSGAIIQAMELRAKAAAYAAMATRRYQEALANKEAGKDRRKNPTFGDKVSGVFGVGWDFDFSKSISREANKAANQFFSAATIAEREADDYLKEQKKLEQEASKLVESAKIKTSKATETVKNKGKNGKAGSGNSTNNTSREQAAAIQEELRYQEELAKIQQEAADARRDAKIAAIENDGERERAEQDEQHKRNIRQIEQQADEMKKAVYEHNKKVWENAHKDSPYELTEEGGKGWQGIQLSDEQGNIIKARMEKENAEYSRMVEKRIKDEEAANKEAINTYLKEYGTYQQKREAIYAEANDQICALEEQLGKATTEEEKSAIEARINTVKAGTKKELDDLDQEIMDKSELWSKFFSDFSNRSSASIRNIMADISDLIDYMNGVEGAKIPDIFADSESTVKAINDAMADPSARKKFTDGLQNQWKIFKKMVDESNPFKLIAQGFKDDDPESLAKGFQGVAQAIGEVKNIMSDLGVEADSTVGKVTSTIGDAASYAAQGAQIGGVWGAAAGAALGIAKGLVGALGADYSDYQTLVEEYGKLIDVWDELIDKKSEYINMSWGEESIRAGEEAVALVNKQTEAYKELGRARLNAGASAGSHSIGVRTRTSMSDADWMAVAASLGRTTADWAGLGGRLEGLFDLSAEQLEKLKEDAPAFWAKLDEETRNYLQGIIDGATKIESMQQQVKEQITGTSFDGVFDSFLSQLNDLADGSEEVFGNVTDNFQKMMNSFVVNNMIGNKLKADLTDWYNRWYEAYNGDKAIDADEVARLREEYDALFKGAASQVEALREQGLIAAVGTEQAQEAKEYFTSLRDSWLSTLTDMTADGKSWAAEITRVMVEDLINTQVLDEGFQSWMDDWKARYKEAVESGNTEAMNALRDEMTAMREELAEKSKDIMDATGYSDLVKEAEEVKDAFSDIRSSWLSALTNMDMDAEKWAESIRRTMVEKLIEKSIVDGALGGKITQWENDLNALFASGASEDEISARMEEIARQMDGDFAGAAESAKKLYEAFNLLEDEVVSDTTFKDMSGDFQNALMNLDGTAEDWAETVGRKMAQKMIGQMVSTTMIQPYLDQLQGAFDAAMSVEGATIESVLAQLAPQIDAAKQAFEEAQPVAQRIMEAFGITQKGEEPEMPFADLRSTFVSSLMDMEADSEKFGKEIGRTLTEQMIDQMLKDQFQDELDKLNSRWAEALENGDSAAIERIREQLVELRQRAEEAVQPLLDDLKEIAAEETPLHGFRSNFLSQLTDMESDTKDFAAEINQILTEAFIDKFVLGDAFDERLAEWEKEYSKLMGDPEMSAEARAKALKQLGENIAAESETMKEQARAIQEMFGTAEYGDQQATVNMADKATYDQFEMYLGIATAQQITGEQQLGVTQQILYTLQAMSGITSPMGGMSEEMRNMWLISNQYLLDIKQSNREILNSFGLKLDSINVKLSKL